MSTDHPLENHPSDGTAPWDGAGSVQGDAPPAGRGHIRVPDAIARRYLRVDKRYFFSDRTLAFIDDGSRIRVQTENREVLRSVVAIAEARGWRVIALKGTEVFRQGMWREAVLRGIEVRGYEPTQAEILQIQRALKNGRPSHETGRDPMPTPPARKAAITQEDAMPSEPGHNAGDPPPETLQGSRSVPNGPRPPVKGMLVATAAAPYQFDLAQRMSFYVMIRTDAGDRSIWGVDLERALAESTSQPSIGDQVVLTQHGARPVTVRVAARDAKGEPVDEQKILAQRVRWGIETSDHLRAMKHHAMRVRTEESLSDAVRDQHPELAMVAADLKLAEQYARRVTSDPISQQRLVQLIRERMADALEQGRSIHLPDRRLHPAAVYARQRVARGVEALSHERV